MTNFNRMNYAAFGKGEMNAASTEPSNLFGAEIDTSALLLPAVQSARDDDRRSSTEDGPDASDPASDDLTGDVDAEPIAVTSALIAPAVQSVDEPNSNAGVIVETPERDELEKSSTKLAFIVAKGDDPEDEIGGFAFEPEDDDFGTFVFPTVVPVYDPAVDAADGYFTEVDEGVEVWGTAGDDILSGSNDIDSIFGFAGNDIINGYDGDDFLLGYEGDDVINGGAGNDLISAGEGNDTLTGGEGSDTFVINLAPHQDLGHKTFTDFVVGEDHLALYNFLDIAPGDDYADVLAAVDGPGGARLFGEVKQQDGLVEFAFFEGVNAAALQAAIFDDTVFA